MPEGLIVRSTGDRMTVLAEDGKQYICRARGKFRIDGTFPLAGDTVAFRKTEGDEHLVEQIAPRKNYLIRPPVANISHLFIVASLAPPVTERLSMDILTAVAEYNGITPVIIVNKTDIQDGSGLADIYRKAGYPTFVTSTHTGEGMESLREYVGKGISVFAGSSGVGKSSLLNHLLPEVRVRTSDISKKIGRGRHTTRHIELFDNGRGGYIVDTPGFSNLDPIQMLLLDKNRLVNCFPEFAGYTDCRWDDCSHTKESGCRILEAVEKGLIDSIRHENYVSIYQSVARLRDYEIRDLLNRL